MILQRIDLHSHTSASDGTLSPKQLVERAITSGLDYLAITDHDTTAGLVELDRQSCVGIIAGVEVSCQWGNKEVHIVGLAIDPKNARLLEGLSAQVQLRRERALAIAQKLERAGVVGSEAFLATFPASQVFCRTHFMRHLLSAGAVKNPGQAFKRFLGPKGKAYVKGQWMSLEKAVALINEAGGVAVLAHPGRYGFTRTKLRYLVSDFKSAGGDALEVIYPNIKPDDVKHLCSLGKDYALKASQGSDFHDPENRWNQLGKFLPLPADCQPVWDDERVLRNYLE